MGASILPGRATTAHLGLVRIANGLQVDTAGNLSVNLASSDIPSLAASKITSGTFGDAYIASGITASKISGALSGATIAGSAVTGAASLSDSILSANVPLLNAANTFTALQTATAFAPTGLTGSTAATRYVGGTTSGAPASGPHNKGDWAIGQDGSLWICTTAGTPGTWAQVSGGGGGFTSPLTTKGDVHAYSTTDARLAVGADGTFLSADSSQATGLAYKFPAGIAGVSTLSTAISADVTLTTANIWYDGPSISLTAGTWCVSCDLTIYNNSGVSQEVSVKLWDGTTVLNSREITAPNGYVIGVTLVGIATVTSTTTWKASATTNNGGTTKMLAAAINNAAGNTASNISAVQLTGAPASGPGALMPAVRCTNSANQSISNNTSTALTFDTNQFDQGTSTAQHSTSSNTSRLTCRQAGVYQISGCVLWGAGSTGVRDLWVTLNGTTVVAESDTPAVSGGSQSISATHYLNVGDYVELYVAQNQGTSVNSVAGTELPNFGMARIDSGPGAVQPNTRVQLDYVASTDLASNLSLTANTWTDLTANHTFTVDDTNSVVEIAVGGCCVVGNTNGQGSSRINIDSAGTPIIRNLGGGWGASNTAFYNILSGSSVIELTGLAIGTHTIKVQIFANGTGAAYCRALTQPNVESFSIRVLERKQSSGPALIPNTKVQLDYRPSTNVINGVSLTTNTWVDILSNQSFTVDDVNSVVDVSVSGCVRLSGSPGNVNTRFVIDSAGTPITRMLGYGYTLNNPLSGTATQSISGLTAGSHTIKLQCISDASGCSAYCRPSTYPDQEFLTIEVEERKQAPTPTLNTTARYHQASGTAQSVSNATTTVINYDTLDLDTQSLVTTGSSWKCTAKTAGNYQVSAAAVLASSIWAGTGKVQLFLYKNGSLYSQLGESTIQVANTDEFCVDGTDIVPLVVDDYISISIYHNQGGAVALIGDGTRNYVAVNRIS